MLATPIVDRKGICRILNRLLDYSHGILSFFRIICTLQFFLVLIADQKELMDQVVDLGVLFKDVERFRTTDHPVLINIVFYQRLIYPERLLSLDTHGLDRVEKCLNFLTFSQSGLLFFEFRKQIIKHRLFDQFLVVLLDDLHVDIVLAVAVFPQE
jgi:hypothetical protein